jgi:hypothetical protein
MTALLDFLNCAQASLNSGADLAERVAREMDYASRTERDADPRLVEWACQLLQAAQHFDGADADIDQARGATEDD